jgi:hypothetical protein
MLTVGNTDLYSDAPFAPFEARCQRTAPFCDGKGIPSSVGSVNPKSLAATSRESHGRALPVGT